MKVKLIRSGVKVLSFISVCYLSLGISPVQAQVDKSNSVMQSTNKVVEEINKVGDEAKAKYAENIDNPYIPIKVNPELNFSRLLPISHSNTGTMIFFAFTLNL